MRKPILFFLFSFLFLFSNAQVNFNNSTNAVLIDFDSSISGVNNSAFTGGGLQSGPAPGQLDGDAWNITGMSIGSHLFGQTSLSNDFARGQSSGGVGTGGLYAFTVSNNNQALGIQPTGSDMTPGTITLKVNNNKSNSIFQIDIDYNIKYRNDQDRSSSMNLSYSFDNNSFTDEPSLNFVSPTSRSSSPTWVNVNKSISIDNISIPPGQSFYIRWTSSDVSGSGSRDELSLDDISLTAVSNSNNCTEPSNQPSNLTFSNITSNSITGSFNTTLADKFLVVQTTAAALSTSPIDGQNYVQGDPLGNGLVIDFVNSTSFTGLSLSPLTTYYYHIFSANDNCTGGPNYKNLNPLVGNAQTTDDGNTGYYSGLDGLSCENLKTALHNLIDDHTVNSYAALWTIYQTTDDRLNDSGNQTIIWDIYTDNPAGPETEFAIGNDQCGTYSAEGDCYNREHTFPRSWWGGSTSNPQYSDAFHVMPADGYLNGIRSNNPYGEVQSGTETYTSANGSKRGSSSISIPGYGGSVFEPIDEYKGDLARVYFYMATRYQDVIASWENSTTTSDAVLNGTSFEVFEDWALTMLLSWHQNDPVSTKEIDRNNEIFGFQNNRNPFIDHPEYVDLIWQGNCSGGSDTQAPTTPTSLTSNNQTANSIALVWNNSSDNVGVTQYNVYQNNTFIGSTASTNYSANGLTPSTTYSYYVNAQDAAGNISGNSNSINVSTEEEADTQAPTAPTSLTAQTITETSIDLTWNSSSDNIGVLQYNLYVDNVYFGSTSTTSFSVLGLTENTSYDFYVNAEDVAGNLSNPSNTLTESTLPSSSGPVIVHQGFFESGLDGWIDGGSDCTRRADGNAYEGNYAIRLRDNSGTASSMTSPVFNLSTFSQVEFSFYFRAVSMENNENFTVSYNNGGSWQVIADYASGVDFNNNQFYQVNLTLDDATYSFNNNVTFRIQCDASGNNDKVYVDQVTLLGLTNSSNAISGSEITDAHIDSNLKENLIANTELEHKSLNIHDVKLYPNPAKERLFFEIPNDGINLQQVIITNTMGQHFKINEITNGIDISQLAIGYYFISFVEKDGQVITKKFIKIN